MPTGTGDKSASDLREDPMAMARIGLGTHLTHLGGTSVPSRESILVAERFVAEKGHLLSEELHGELLALKRLIASHSSATVVVDS